MVGSQESLKLKLHENTKAFALFADTQWMNTDLGFRHCSSVLLATIVDAIEV